MRKLEDELSTFKLHKVYLLRAILNLRKEQEIFTIDEIIIKVHKDHGVLLKRSALATRLGRLVNDNMIKRVGKGIYK
jgi:hypothetical protein